MICKAGIADAAVVAIANAIVAFPTKNKWNYFEEYSVCIGKNSSWVLTDNTRAGTRHP